MRHQIPIYALQLHAYNYKNAHSIVLFEIAITNLSWLILARKDDKAMEMFGRDLLWVAPFQKVKIFNYRLSKARCKTKCTFGLLAS